MQRVLVELQSVTVDIPLKGVPVIESSQDRRLYVKNGKLWIRALDNVSLKIFAGDRIGVIGGNGNGKTTLLKAIGGVLPISHGSIIVHAPIRTLLSNDAGCSMYLSGRKNIELCYELLQIKSMTFKEYLQDVIDFSDLGPFIDIPVMAYSPGMRSRLQFAMNTVECAPVLLMDEWLGVSDRQFQDKAKHRLLALMDRCEAMLFASHNEDLISKLTDKKLKIDKGLVKEII